MVNKQGFENFIEQDISMVRGDTLSFNFQIAGLGEDEPTFEMICRETYTTNNLIFSADSDEGIDLIDDTNGVKTYAVWVHPIQTSGTKAGRYVYDLRMTNGEDKLTLMRGYLTILEKVRSSNGF